MHLNAYMIDGTLLRTGSANFSASGLKRQNNDLLLIGDQRLADRFKKEFELLWSNSYPLP